MYDCGDFIDDYAVHRVYRNSLSFVFLLNFEYSNNNNYDKYNNNGNSSHCKIKEIELIPTRIYDFSVNTALLEEDEEIVIRTYPKNIFLQMIIKQENCTSPR